MTGRYSDFASHRAAALEITHSLIQAGKLSSPDDCQGSTQTFVERVVQTAREIEEALKIEAPSSAGFTSLRR